MTFQDCLDGHAERGTLTEKQIEQLKDEYDNLIAKRLATGNPDPTATTVAFMKIVADRLAHQRYAKRLHAFRTLANRQEIDEIFTRWDNSFKNLSKTKQRLLGLAGGRPTKARLYRDILVRADQRGDTLLAEFILPLKPIIEKHSRTMNPLETKARLESFEATMRSMLNGDEAVGELAEMVGALRSVNDLIVKEYRLAGGIIGKITNYAPQVHDRRRILPPDANPDDARVAWKKYIGPRLDQSKMIDFETGAPLTGTRLDEVLDDIFDSITKLGEPPPRKGFKSGDVMSRRERMRQLHFKDGDKFLEYNEEYGIGKAGLFDAYMNHISVMARDIGTMQTLGPKAKAAHKTLIGHVGRDDADYTGQMFRTLVGPSTMRDNEAGWLKYMEVSKNIIRASLLDMSGITALNDVTFAKLTADMHGLSGFDAFAKWWGNITPGEADSMLAMNGGHHVANMLMAQSISMARAMEGDGLSSGWSVGLNNWTQRASLMHHVTNATANAISQTYSLELGGLIRQQRAWADLDPKFQQLLGRGRITQAEWDGVILKTTPQQMGANDGFYILPEDITSIPRGRVNDAALGFGGLQEIGRKLSDIDVSLRFEATNAPTLKTRTLSTGGLQAQSFERQTRSALLMFKSFPLQVMQNHFLPAVQQSIEKGFMNLEKGGFTRSLMTVGTLGLAMGMATIQMKEISKGRTPRDPETAADWAKLGKDAMIISGFGGFLGDLLLRDRDGRPMAQDLAGPWFGAAEAPFDLMTSIGDAIYENVTGENEYDLAEQIMADVFRTVRTYIPAKDLPYYQFASERLVADQIAEWMSPGLFEDRNERLRSRVLEPRGQDYWLEPAALTQ